MRASSERSAGEKAHPDPGCRVRHCRVPSALERTVVVAVVVVRMVEVARDDEST
jgi:hypothetical protein